MSSNYDNVTRVEVIDRFGRSYSNWNVDDIKFSLQDDGKTLKLFLTSTSLDAVECDI